MLRYIITFFSLMFSVQSPTDRELAKSTVGRIIFPLVGPTTQRVCAGRSPAANHHNGIDQLQREFAKN